MVSSSGAASHLPATGPLSSPVLHRLRDETAVFHTQSASGKSNSSIQRSSCVKQQSNRHRGRRSEAPAQRRWPSGNPRLSAFCRSAPAVRFMTFAIFLTGDLLRECAFSSRTSAFDQLRRLVRLARLLAISHSCERHAAAATLSIAEPALDEKTIKHFAKVI